MQEKEKSAGKTAKAKEPKKSWFQGLEGRDSTKLSGQTHDTLMKQSVVVIVITVILGVIISVMDAGILECINLLIK